MRKVSTQDILQRMCSCLRTGAVVDKELDSILNAANQFNSACESRIEAIQKSLGEADLNAEQIHTLERNYELLERSKELAIVAIVAIERADGPGKLYEMVKGHVRSVSMQMKALSTGGFDDLGLSKEGEALLRYMNSYDKLL